MKYKLAVFDMDGTILDTLEDLKNSVNYALCQLNYPLRTLDEVRNFVGNGIPKLIERAVPAGTDKENELKVYQIFTQHYKLHCNDKTCVYNGIIDCLKSLKDGGVKLCVVSNKDDYACKELSKLHFGDLFDFSLGRSDGINKKPAPDMVNIALDYFNMENIDACYIGDSDVDFMTAKNSNLDFIGVSWGFKGYQFLQNLGAKVIVNEASEIVDIFLND